MNIPDKAVEAAARDLYETEPLALVNEATETMAAKPWEWLSEDFRAHKMQQARATLEAAAPFIAAQAWDEGYMRGQYPFTVEGQEDPIPPARFPPPWGGNANPYRDPQ